jgi:hypothetical protein
MQALFKKRCANLGDVSINRKRGVENHKRIIVHSVTIITSFLKIQQLLKSIYFFYRDSTKLVENLVDHIQTKPY